MATSEIQPMEIDDSLYSRQRYVLGDNAMKKMAQSKVFLSGLDCLGVEIAKNIVLAGVKELVIHDPTIVTIGDIGTQFFLREFDIGKKRDSTTCPRLAELNPYVTVKVLNSNLSSGLVELEGFTCVIFVNCESLQLLELVNQKCRKSNPQIRFISASSFGVFASVFTDFGDTFEVLDKNGEECHEFFISGVTNVSPGVVSCIEHELHDLETNDFVTFKEVEGMVELNSGEYKVTVTSPKEFTICDTTDFKPYKTGGICIPIKKPFNMSFKPLCTQLYNPDIMLCDLGKIMAPPQIHLAYITMLQFVARQGRKPQPRDQTDLELMLKLADEIVPKFESGLMDKPDPDIIADISNTCTGTLQPLCAAIGGIVAQEALIALTNKFTPILQWLHLDAREVIPRDELGPEEFCRKDDRYDPLRICIGDTLLQKLKGVNSFMVGCGAIGCEMIKNIALIGMSTKGQFVITDNDLIEKSNLNRQFLFRDKHIQQPKSTTASNSAKEINPELRIIAHQNKVGPQTEHSHYTDEFFSSQDVIINALDNVETRMYMDSRCVTNQRPLLESGTMGPKGHVQVIIPFLTESYASQADPPEKDVPYCTLKSFPGTIEHCIIWSRDKYETLFVQKPQMYTQFWRENLHPQEVLSKMQQKQLPENCIGTIKMLQKRIITFKECIEMSRVKFEKYFSHKAKDLRNAFPDDQKLQDGTLFWASPKRKPEPITFNIKDDTHIEFVIACAKLLAFRSGIQVTDKECEIGSIVPIVEQTRIPIWKKSDKIIETDESKTREESKPLPSNTDIIQECIQYLAHATNHKISAPITNMELTMEPNKFEKDNDNNSHIDFITSASNLRAQMYLIESADRLKIKRIAGRIVPAIATTTAAVSGLVALELIKIIKKCKIEDYKNCFMSLAVPNILFSEPGSVTKSEVCPGLSITLWDKWEVKGHQDFTIKEFVNDVTTRFKIKPTMIVQGVRMIYVPLIMPTHAKRINHPISKYITKSATENYVDLVVTFDNDEGEPIDGPPIRYFMS